jgi:hypothetical protein
MTQNSVQFITRRREDAKMGVLGAFVPSRLRVIPLSRRPSEGWGPSRLSTKHRANWIDDIGPSLRWGDVMFGIGGRL